MTVKKSTSQPEDIKRQDVIEQALELRLGGKSYRRIAALLNISVGTAHNYITEHLKKRREENAELSEDVIEMEIARLDKQLEDMETFKTNFPHKAPEAATVILRIQDRRAKYLGLDKPTKVAPTSPDGDAPYEDNTGIKEQLVELLKRKNGDG